MWVNTYYGEAHTDIAQANEVVFEQVEYPPSMRIITREDEEHTEVVMKIQGVLCASMLPPYRCQPWAITPYARSSEN